LLVGVSAQCDYPSAARQIEGIGTFSRPNLEKIISLSPDIVFLTGLEQETIYHNLKKIGVRTIKVFPQDTAELFEDILTVGSVLDCSRAAEVLVAQLKADMKEVLISKKQGVAPSMMIQISNNPLIVAGNNSFVGKLGELAGGSNIAFDVPRVYSRFSLEVALERDPACIFITQRLDAKQLKTYISNNGLGHFQAVQDNFVFADIDPDVILRPGPRFVQGLRAMVEKINAVKERRGL